jgi:hypothetical protein
MQKKFPVRIELKQGEGDPDGAFRAVFARFNVIDHDGDVTLPGAFEVGAKTRIAGMGHNWNIPTIGAGTIGADDTEAWIDGQFNLKMVQGREHYESVKFDLEQGSKSTEWSYAYDDLTSPESKREIAQWPGAKRILAALKVHEVSPVMLGAGIGTGTLSVKARRRALAKQGPMSDEEKRAAIQQAVTRQDAADDVAAGEDPGWDSPWIISVYPDYVIVLDDDSDGYLQVGYTIDADGNVTLGPSIDVEQVWVPTAADAAAMKYAEQGVRTLAVFASYADRSKQVHGLRAKSKRKIGRRFSDASREAIAASIAAARATADDLEALLTEADAVDPEKASAIRYLRAKAQLMSEPGALRGAAATTAA